MKKHKLLITVIALISLLSLIIFIFSEDEDKYIKEVNVKEVLEKIDNKETFILYIKQTTCDHCKIFNPRFVSALKENNLTSLAINLTNLSNEDQELFYEKINVNQTPTVLFYIDGNRSLITIKGSQTKDKIVSLFESAGFIK